MVIEFTAFPSIFDNKTHRRFSFNNWNMFSAALLNMAKKPGYKPKKEISKEQSDRLEREYKIALERRNKEFDYKIDLIE